METKRAYVLTVVFLGTRAGYCNASSTLSMVAKSIPIVVCNNFEEGFDIKLIKICHLKEENKWESSGRLDLNGLDIEGLKETS